MAGMADVLDTERGVGENGEPTVTIKVDPVGGANGTLDHFSAPGDDALPLPGDIVAVSDGAGTGNEQTTGCHDTKNAGKALPGEKRMYARDSTGKVICEVWLKGSGSIRAENQAGGYIELKDDGKVEFNGVIVDLTGEVKAPAEITAMAAAALVTLSKHLHPTAMGPSGPPTPGT